MNCITERWYLYMLNILMNMDDVKIIILTVEGNSPETCSKKCNYMQGLSPGNERFIEESSLQGNHREANVRS